MFLAEIAASHSIFYVVLFLPIIYLVVYIVYQRFGHPLAKYPGPFWASITDVWQVLEYLSLKQPYNLTKLHEKYGPVVRYGPDKISITHESAVYAIYQKSSRALPKTEFYDAFGGANPNVFGTRDEAHHSVRRRHMSYAFSMASIKSMEPYFDVNIDILKQKILRESVDGRVFDLKKLFHYYVIDVLGDLAFSKSFDLQVSEDESRIPPVKEHTLLGSTTGSWPAMLPWLKKLLPKVPLQGVQKLFKGRQTCAELASKCVQRRLWEIEATEAKGDGASPQRKDLLTTLILARHPDTGEKLTKSDLETEAFGFIIAGTHTTSATATLLFYHLLHNPEYLRGCVAEIDANLPRLGTDRPAYSVTEVEASLPFLRTCVKENFRLTPVFTLPLARRVTPPEGLVIEGDHFGQGTSIAVCNHAMHHNPVIWGPDHNNFDPTRWNRPEIAEKSRLLMHFGLGGRQCIGKNMAMANIYKIMSTLLSEFEFQLADAAEQSRVQQGRFKGTLPPLISVGVSDLETPLWVRATQRSPS